MTYAQLLHHGSAIKLSPNRPSHPFFSIAQSATEGCLPCSAAAKSNSDSQREFGRLGRWRGDGWQGAAKVQRAQLRGPCAIAGLHVRAGRSRQSPSSTQRSCLTHRARRSLCLCAEAGWSRPISDMAASIAVMEGERAVRAVGAAGELPTTTTTTRATTTSTTTRRPTAEQQLQHRITLGQGNASVRQARLGEWGLADDPQLPRATGLGCVGRPPFCFATR